MRSRHFLLLLLHSTRVRVLHSRGCAMSCPRFVAAFALVAAVVHCPSAIGCFFGAFNGFRTSRRRVFLPVWRLYDKQHRSARQKRRMIKPRTVLIVPSIEPCMPLCCSVRCLEHLVIQPVPTIPPALRTYRVVHVANTAGCPEWPSLSQNRA